MKRGVLVYKVLLVDDERIILDGISRIVDWAAAGTVLIGTARNGLEAYAMIEQEPPDIVISDIRMPGMDGLELVSKVTAQYPGVRFIMLSGFGEFDYARSAMQYGVRHYLLKPCNEAHIVEALRELAEELRESERRETFVQNLKQGLAKVLPHVKEQFLKEFVTNKTYGGKDWEYYGGLFDLQLDGRKVRLVLFQLEGPFEFEHLFAVKNIAEELLNEPLLSSTVGEHVLVVIRDEEAPERLHDRIARIRETFLGYYKIDLTIALSDADDIVLARRLYRQTLECLKHRFYLGEGSLITRQDITDADGGEGKELTFDEEDLLLQLKAGRWDDASSAIDRFFQQLGNLRSDIQTAKSYAVQLFMAIARLGPPGQANQAMDQLVALAQMETLQSIQHLVKSVAKEIAHRQYERNKRKHSAIVRKVMDVVDEHLGDSELSLNWVARRILYMNADYLGKLFKKETGDKFSNYVIRRRIARAAEWLASGEDMKIFELAERLGFGDNPQYFSQVFKKYVGLTPSEYSKAPTEVGFLNKDNGFLD